jgi:hypothetical protein
MESLVRAVGSYERLPFGQDCNTGFFWLSGVIRVIDRIWLRSDEGFIIVYSTL